MTALIDCLVVTVASLLAAFSIRFLFNRLNAIAIDELQSDVKFFIQGGPPKPSKLFMASRLMGALFGNKYVSKRSLLFSTTMSMAVFMLTAVLLRKAWTTGADADVLKFLLAIPTLGLLVNVLPDCLIFLKSRWIFEAASGLSSARQKVELYCCDVIGGINLKLAALLLFEVLITVLDGGPTTARVLEAVADFAATTVSGGRPTIAAIMFTATAISAELWIVVFAISLRLGEAIYKRNSIPGWFRRWAADEKVREQPLVYIGNVACVLTGLVVMVVGALASFVPFY